MPITRPGPRKERGDRKVKFSYFLKEKRFFQIRKSRWWSLFKYFLTEPIYTTSFPFSPHRALHWKLSTSLFQASSRTRVLNKPGEWPTMLPASINWNTWLKMRMYLCIYRPNPSLSMLSQTIFGVELSTLREGTGEKVTGTNLARILLKRGLKMSKLLYRSSARMQPHS